MAEFDLKKPFHRMETKAVLNELKSDQFKGLTTQEAVKRIGEYGLNQLEKEKKNEWSRFTELLKDKFSKILFMAGLISFMISKMKVNDEWDNQYCLIEPLIIFTVLIINILVSIDQDSNAENAIEELKFQQHQFSSVLRDGVWKHIEVEYLTVGDIIEIRQGERIPADLRLIELKSDAIKTDQKLLTNDLNLISKQPHLIDIEEIAIENKNNYLFAGTFVIYGCAICIIVQIGMQTEIGQILKMHQKVKEEKEDPLYRSITNFAEKLSIIVIVICILSWMFDIGSLFGQTYGGFLMAILYYSKISIALAVAILPEGYTAFIATCLAIGAKRMAHLRVIIKKLKKVQILGCTTVICADKTGTITTDDMCARHIILLETEEASSYRIWDIEGQNKLSEGNISGLEQIAQNSLPHNFKKFCIALSLCNESSILIEKGQIQKFGLNTEIALNILIEKIGTYDLKFRQNLQKEKFYKSFLLKDFDKLLILPYTKERKCMSVIAKEKSTKKNSLFSVGEVSRILERCDFIVNANGDQVPLNKKDKFFLLNMTQIKANEGFRTVGICIQDSNYNDGNLILQMNDANKYKEYEGNAILLGIAILEDPIRPEVKQSIQSLRAAGITTIMITGDIKEVAQSVALKTEILSSPSQFPTNSFTGLEFSIMTAEKQKKVISEAITHHQGLVFSRTDSKHKREIIRILTTQLNQTTVMVGDGVNDASALKEANIGIAMGISGTEVAKEASDIILADDNFETIVHCIEEGNKHCFNLIKGRAISQNIKGFLRYIVSSNISELLTIVVSSALGIPNTINSIQLLWVNLITDGLPAIAFSFNPPEVDGMKKKPKRQDDQIQSNVLLIRFLLVGVYAASATIFISIYYYLYWEEDDHTLITFEMLSNWKDCQNWKNFELENFGKFNFSLNPCNYFTEGKAKATTLSLSVLIIIEMLNAINSQSEEISIFNFSQYRNVHLLLAIGISFILHCIICYVEYFQQIFLTYALSLSDWYKIFELSINYKVICFYSVPANYYN